MSEFTVVGQTYRTTKIDAMRQFHLSRKIAPVIPALIPVFAKLAESQKAEGTKPLSSDLAAMASLFEPFAEAVATMSDETAEYVMGTCLSVISRQQGTTWAPIWNDRQKVCMFDDIDSGVMLQLAAHVVRESLGPFLAGLLSTSAQG
ncbi:phage tail assembly chaperone [Pseudomonas nitroreducens]|uniref:phage tail assembly chaperone n=1 Tax=Pseudomonas nitroreducens TaxID=46680 RepID=UPI003CC8265A